LQSGASLIGTSGGNAQTDLSSFGIDLSNVIIDNSGSVIAPNKVLNVATAPTTNNSQLQVTWSVPLDNGTAIVNYLVQYRENGTTAWATLNPRPTTNTAIISGLSSGVTYDIRVAANNSFIGEYSDIAQAEIFDVLSLNPIAWLSATDINNGGASPNHGDKISSWSDLTGQATDAVEIDINRQPTYRTNVFNGMPAVYFDGTLSQGLEGTFTRSNNGGLTVLVVGKLDTNNQRQCLFEFYEVNGSDRGFFFNYGFNEASTNYNLDDTSFNLWTAYDDGTRTDFWENGTNLYTDKNNWTNTSFTGDGSYVLGDDQTGNDEFAGYIGEFLIFDRELTAQELSTLQNYLKNKWGTP
jgi:hypothetical protein